MNPGDGSSQQGSSGDKMSLQGAYNCSGSQMFAFRHGGGGESRK